MAEEHGRRVMVAGRVLLEMEGELLRAMVVELVHRVMAAEHDRLGTEAVAGRQLLLGQQHQRLGLLLRLVLHLRLGLLLVQRREGLSRGIRREERSRRNGLSSRRVRGRVDLAAITMEQRHDRPATAARPVLAAVVVVHAREVDQSNENFYA
jgi:hypothetical protein